MSTVKNSIENGRGLAALLGIYLAGSLASRVLRHRSRPVRHPTRLASEPATRASRRRTTGPDTCMINRYDIAYSLGLGLAAPVWLALPRARRKVLRALRERMGHDMEISGTEN